MKARTGMLLGMLLLLSAIAQANERAPAKPIAIKLATELKLDDARPAAQHAVRTAAEGAHFACDNGTTADAAAESARAPAGKSVKSVPATPKRARRLGCDSFHCVARGTAPAAGEAAGTLSGA